MLLLILIIFEFVTASLCLVGVLISARIGGATFKYFQHMEVAWQVVFVPSICIAVAQIIMLGFTLNLYCYHRWLRKNDLTTLEHIFKHNSSKNINQVIPKVSVKSESGTEKETERLQLKATGGLQSSSRAISSKVDSSSNLHRDNADSAKGSISESVSIGKPKSTFHQAQDYMNQQCRNTLNQKMGSLKNVQSRSKFLKKEPRVEEPTANKDKEQKSENTPNGVQINPPKKLHKQLAKMKIQSNGMETSNAEKIDTKSVQKKKLPSIGPSRE